MASLLSKAIAMAATVHDGQTDKAGEPYILHPIAVMNLVQPLPTWMGFSREDHERLMILAVLHDVVEDYRGGNPGERAMFRQALRRTFGDAICDSLDCLTRRSGETYGAYIERIAHDPFARRVKIADLTHNMDTGRLPEGDIGEKDFERWDKYRRSLVRLKLED